MFKEIPLKNSNYVALIDDKDFALVSKYLWRIVTSGKGEGLIRYAYTYSSDFRKVDGKFKMVLMHRLLKHDVNKNKSDCIDHINHNGLDNRQCNLRFATYSQNRANAKKHKVKKLRSSSELKGVYWIEKKHRWEAGITYSKKRKYLGHFKNKGDAAEAYNKAAIFYFKRFAGTN